MAESHTCVHGMMFQSRPSVVKMNFVLKANNILQLCRKNIAVSLKSTINTKIGPRLEKPDFVAFKQQRHRSECTSEPSLFVLWKVQ